MGAPGFWDNQEKAQQVIGQLKPLNGLLKQYEEVNGAVEDETGVHRLVRISPFGSGDTRQTSFAAVDVTPELDETIDIQIDESKLEVQTFSAGGPGGQHQNKTQSGVRIIHSSGVRAESR